VEDRRSMFHRSGDLPDGMKGHPFVRRRYFYTLPLKLWDALETNLGKERFDLEHLKIERELSELNGDHTSSVGFHYGVKLLYTMLRPPGPLYELARQYAHKFAKDPEAEIRTIEAGEQQVCRLQRAYHGWLLTNREFVDEHDGAFLELAQSKAVISVPKAIPPTTAAFRKLYEMQTVRSPRQESVAKSFNEFMIKWQIQQLPGPYLPFPSPMNLSADPTDIERSSAKAAKLTVAIIPDTMPLPEESLLRKRFEAARQQKDLPHLQEWTSIIAASNPGKSTFDPYARLFEIQHYLRSLILRHPRVFFRKKRALEEAFADFFQVSRDTIYRDLGQLCERLGCNIDQLPSSALRED
jgi:hypothetical protein